VEYLVSRRTVVKLALIFNLHLQDFLPKHLEIKNLVTNSALSCIAGQEEEELTGIRFLR
jgi:hypothetical protein